MTCSVTSHQQLFRTKLLPSPDPNPQETELQAAQEQGQPSRPSRPRSRGESVPASLSGCGLLAGGALHANPPDLDLLGVLALTQVPIHQHQHQHRARSYTSSLLRAPRWTARRVVSGMWYATMPGRSVNTAMNSRSSVSMSVPARILSARRGGVRKS